MTKAILEKITKIEDLLYFSKAYKEGLININISKLARELGKDFKTVKCKCQCESEPLCWCESGSYSIRLISTLFLCYNYNVFKGENHGKLFKRIRRKLSIY